MLRSENGFFGEYGGSFVSEVLHETIVQLTEAYEQARLDPSFWDEYQRLLKRYSCRPTPLSFAENLTKQFDGPQIYIKREDFNYTGAHKFNNALGQGLLTRRMGKTRIIAETGAGQHGVATATVAAKLGLDCTIYMGAIDMKRQYPNVFWMQNLGAKVVAVETGSKTLKDAVNAALADWFGNMDNTHYVVGSAVGSHPFPEMVMWFQSVIGVEAREQIYEQSGKLPRVVYACMGGGSNALGCFAGFLDDKDVQLVGVEAGGKGLEGEQNAAKLAAKHASVGIAQGFKTYFLQNSDGQMLKTHSVAAGLDYMGISPIIAYLADSGRVQVKAATDEQAIAALRTCMKVEGIIPALESAHAFAQAFADASNYNSDDVILINQSGRGDKDIFTIAEALGDKEWQAFIKRKAAEMSI